MAGIGHNSGDDVITAAAQGRLKSFVERLERLDEDLDVIKSDKKEVFAEAKGEGFDVKTLRKLIAERKKDRVKAAEERALLELYASAIGMDLV